ncbi:MAG: 30S ribosomal protein S4, partial [Acidobacteriota bacterium]|nr:30S ribosomal protein S4 [Acidobacteriota bacterium]
YEVKVDDVVNLTEKATNIPVVSELLAETETANVEWLERKGAVVKVKRLPVRDDIKEKIDEQMVIEYYSR